MSGPHGIEQRARALWSRRTEEGGRLALPITAVLGLARRP
ncbi:hypothetical protein Bfae_06400 [Brachybacterium faecium DSM 4810]|uniref:Uncharacterized protein n=1 Tax=Brachybacterium faecium (strain ATCC 43885 / DSM 4810 / JCM 11609 / LMG 19847 / NBRC 14762 / NCIMB 9860 / 6-10) TaxID=446465 RepID=C7MI79_BRAFD|nr:hypothetical protein Bfae_06400 [Brachybacterium faecium DSM 4810]